MQWEKREDSDPVNHPSHYISPSGLETIDVISAFGDVKWFCWGNIVKYILRFDNKNGLEDLKKAQWYLNHLIEIIEKEENTNETV